MPQHMASVGLRRTSIGDQSSSPITLGGFRLHEFGSMRFWGIGSNSQIKTPWTIRLNLYSCGDIRKVFRAESKIHFISLKVKWMYFKKLVFIEVFTCIRITWCQILH